MIKIAVIRRELPLYKLVLLRLLIALAGVAIAIVTLSAALGMDPSIVAKGVLKAFVRIDAFRYIVVFIPVGLGLAIAYHAKLWNLGAEGQMVLGAIAATFIALYTPLKGFPIAGPIAALLFATLTGALWALIPALLRVYLGVNEALATLMMNYIAYYLADYLVYGPWRGRGVYGFPMTDSIPDVFKLPWIHGYSFSLYSLIASFAFVPIVYAFLYRSRMGIAIRGLGSSRSAVDLSGIPSKRIAIIAFALSGALAGYAGGNEVLMYHRKLVPGENVSAGMGFISILVAWFADLNPLMIPLAAYYVSALHYLRTILQVGELTEAVTRFFIGVIFLLLLVSVFISKYKVVVKRC